MAFNDKFDKEEIEHFFECCDLSATSGEIQKALAAVLKCKTSFHLTFRFFKKTFSFFRSSS